MWSGSYSWLILYAYGRASYQTMGCLCKLKVAYPFAVSVSYRDPLSMTLVMESIDRVLCRVIDIALLIWCLYGVYI